MEELENKIKETNFTQDEWQTFKKVELNNRLNDLQMVLTEMLDNEELTQDELATIMENIDLVIEKFDDYLDCDWRSAMQDAIKYVL